MGVVEIIALSMGLAWASGINLYAAIATLGILGATGEMTLPPGLEILADPVVIAAAGFMYCVEFFADKMPGVDTGWDALHSFIRIPAGAVLAAAALGDISPAAQIAAAIVGGGLAATSHGLKSGGRILINTSPEPVTNWTVSVAEDMLVVGGLIVAVYHPMVFYAALALFVVLAIWLLPKMWRAIRSIFTRIKGWLGSKPETAAGGGAHFNPGALPGAPRIPAGPGPE